jgi:hypothetical protein
MAFNNVIPGLKLPVGAWMPDQPDYANPGSITALNVIPAAASYRPFPSLLSVTGALTARAQGGFYAKRSDGTPVIFAGDATKLYRLSGTTWSDVSRTVGGAYTCPADGYWQFVQFGPLVIAVNGGPDAAQKFNIESDTNFSALGGSPPASPRYIMVVGDFVVLMHTTHGNTYVEWSGINNAETWTASATTLADAQQLPDGGRIMGGSGGQYGIIVQEHAVRRMSFVGSPFVFQFDKIHDQVGSAIDYCVTTAPGGRVFFIDRIGVNMLQVDQLTPIGAMRIDRSFWNHPSYGINQNYLYRTSTAINPAWKLWAVSVVSALSTDGTPDLIWLYQWDVDRWSIAKPGPHEMIVSLATATAGQTLETLDTFGSLEAQTLSFDSYLWAGISRPIMGGFLTTHAFGFFEGPALEATIDTTEGDIFSGRKGELQWLRVLVDGSSPTAAMGTRANLSDAVSWGEAKARNPTNGLNGNFRSTARYHRARITIPAASTWDHVQGIVDIQGTARGYR